MTGCNELDDNDDDEPSVIFLFTVHLTTLGFSDCTASKPLVVASRSEVWVWPLACWVCGFESRREQGCLSLYCEMSGRSICVGLITRPEES